MSRMSVKETEKYIRDEIRNYGLVFKKSKYNNFYVVTDRKTKEVIVSNATLGGTLENVCSGYFSCYNKDEQNFNREKLMNLGLIY